VWMRVPAPEPVRPSGYDRALAPWRDRLARAATQPGGVVADFEMLPRFADRPDVHSLHHVLLGRYTFSNRAFVPPDHVGTLVADMSGDNLMPYFQPGSSSRMDELLGRNDLVPVAAHGDLVMFARTGTAPLALVGPDTASSPANANVDLDGVLDYIGTQPFRCTAQPGDALAFEIRWRRTGPIDRTYLMNLALIDAGGVARAGRSRLIGYGAWGPETWPIGSAMRERAGFVLPTDLAPGSYTLYFDVGWRVGSRRGRARSDLAEGALDPRMRLGVVEVTPASRASR
jgi:hypothetical protein